MDILKAEFFVSNSTVGKCPKPDKHEYAFTHEMSSGDFENSARLDMMKAASPLEPGTETESTAEEYPEYTEYETPNLNHLAIKAGTYSSLLENTRNFVNNELLWCTDTKQLYIMSNGSLNWIN